jgi:allantoate deiminase
MPVNKKRLQKDIDTINGFNTTPGSGITRLTFSPEYQGAVAYVIDELKVIGADIYIGPAGNVRARLDGSDDRGPAVMMGSHLDTVAHGGQFDGVVGVVTALETARAIAEDSIKHRLPVDVVIFAEEEGSRFSRGLLGSSIWTGQMSPDLLAAVKDDRNISYLEAMTQAGMHVDDDRTLKSSDIKAMLEVHIEQGAVLEKRRHRIGLVEAIAGIRQLDITIKGKADHAGTTPMGERSDALQAAARIIIAIDEIAGNSGPHGVATVGRITCIPAQVNVIPGRARFSVDVRNSDRELLESAVDDITRAVTDICRGRQLDFDIDRLAEAEPVALSANIVELMEKKALRRNTTSYKLISGAGHDTALVAGLAEAGMIFVPSRDGRSHCPQEFTRIEDIVLGCEILLDTVVELAA